MASLSSVQAHQHDQDLPEVEHEGVFGYASGVGLGDLPL
jgi:hypothetical protein